MIQNSAQYKRPSLPLVSLLALVISPAEPYNKNICQAHILSFLSGANLWGGNDMPLASHSALEEMDFMEK
jgi:hypothetical protein